MNNPKVHELKQYITTMIKEILLEESKRLFAEHPDITSFGWHQFIDSWSIDRYIQFEESLKQPDVNGNLGEFIYSGSDLYPTQKKVANFLKQFDKDLLISAFGKGVDVAIYKDNTIEILAENEYNIPYYIEL